MADKTSKADESLQQQDLTAILSKSSETDHKHTLLESPLLTVSAKKKKCGHITYFLLRYNKCTYIIELPKEVVRIPLSLLITD